MNLKQNKSGFTLLEIIIVIIIVGVLASLALPRFFATVEFSKSTEALTSMAVLRQSVERCYLATAGTYVGCTVTNIDVEDPGNSPGARFTYSITGQSATGYVITATRNTVDGGGGTANWINLTQSTAGVVRAGSGAFIGIK
jgi:type IV pilus assembly protein PilE